MINKCYPRNYRTMRHIIICVIATLLWACSGGDEGTKRHVKQDSDTLYTFEAAMAVYGFSPERALHILDSAVIVGNVPEHMALFGRMRIYSMSHMHSAVDSLLHGPEGVRLDSARAIGIRLLQRDSEAVNLATQQDVLEVLLYTAQQQCDSIAALRWARQLVDVCHREDAETEALRNEAEVGLLMCQMGQTDAGLARLDSVIGLLDDGNGRFNELDATIIAMKRKINALTTLKRYAETLPLSRRIIDALNDYEAHPLRYHDGTYREPADSASRADYIQFYRSQAQEFITAAYAALGDNANMVETYEQLESAMLETSAREHLARYKEMERRLQEKIKLQEAENRNSLMRTATAALIVGILLILLFALYMYYQNRRIKEKNHALVKLIEQQQQQSSHDASPKASNDDNRALFEAIDTRIRNERLFAKADLGRQDICDLFSIRREVLNKLLTDHADGLSFPAYINSIRMAEACRLLRDERQMTVTAIAENVGLTVRNLRKIFAEQYGMTPTEFRNSN